MPSFPPLLEQLVITNRGTADAKRVFRGDVKSANWDGGGDLSAGADVAATQGYLIDYGTGRAQFQTIYAKGGEFTGTITATGGSFTGTITATGGSLGDLDVTGDIAFSGGAGSLEWYNTSEALQATLSWNQLNGQVLMDMGSAGDFRFLDGDVTVDGGRLYADQDIYMNGEYLKGGSVGIWQWYTSEFPAGTEKLTLIYDHSGGITGMPVNTITYSFAGFDPLPGTFVMDVNGSIVTEGLEVEYNDLEFSEAAAQKIHKTGSGHFYIDLEVNANMYFRVKDSGGTLRNRMAIDGDGHHTFYDNSGVTAMIVEGSSGNVNLNSNVIYGALRFQASGDGSASATLLRSASNGGTGPYYDYISTYHRWYVAAGGVAQTITTSSGAFVPATNNTKDLGNASIRWAEVFAVNGTINTSDEREKDINWHGLQSGDALRLVRQSHPMSYRWKDGKRTHFGFGYQTMRDDLINAGFDPNVAMMIDPEVSDEFMPEWRAEGEEPDTRTLADLPKGLRYTEWIAVNTAAIQALADRLDDLEEKVAT